MKISILTLFPEMFEGPFDYSIIKNAKVQKKVNIEFINIRDFGIGKHKVVDDKPYGGGHGMILRVDVLSAAIAKAKGKNPEGVPSASSNGQKVVLLSPHGKTFTQKKAQELSALSHLILVCGRYEGVDERAKRFVDEEISIGDFIVTGGEIPAMLVTDAVVRLLRGVLKEGVTTTESFSLPAGGEGSFLSDPPYTKTKIHKKPKIPPLFFFGDH